jgi:hypothetical protein
LSNIGHARQPFSSRIRMASPLDPLWAEAGPKAPDEPPPAPVVEYCVGLDLGQAQDFSALCVVERTAPAGGAGEAHYAVRHLHRWPLGTLYAAIAADVAALVRRPPLSRPWLAIDKTGVGTAALELFDPGDLAADQRPILITAG